jgi:hypothetical protein
MKKLTLLFGFILLFSAMHASPSAAQGRVSAEEEKFLAYYPVTKIGTHGFGDIDYNRITNPGPTFTVQNPNIYADMANTRQLITNTEVENGTVHQSTSYASALSNSSQSRNLKVGETVYITKLKLTPTVIQMELLTTDQVTLGDGRTTRYRAEVTFHIDTSNPASKADDAKKLIDPVLVSSSAASAQASQSKTVNLGMTVDQVKQALGEPDKTINLGPKTIFVYKDIKVVFVDSKVSDVQ